MASNTLNRMQSLRSQGSLTEAVQPKGVFAVILATVRRWFASSTGVLLKLAMYLSGSILMSPLVLIPLFICLKVDGSVDWSWSTTAIILWVFDGILFVMLVLSSCDSSNKQEKNQHPILGFLCQVLCEIFVVLRLDHHITWSWSVVFIPFYVGSVVGTSSNSFFQLLQIIFLALKLDGTVTWKWEVVFIPTWIPLAFFLVFVPVGIIVINCISDDPMPVRNTIALCFGGMTLAGLVGAAPVLLVVRQYHTFSTLYIALPWFILVGIAFVGGLVAVLFIDFRDDGEAQQPILSQA